MVELTTMDTGSPGMSLKTMKLKVMAPKIRRMLFITRRMMNSRRPIV